MKADVLCDGAAEGQVLRLEAPISFWGGVDPQTGQITMADHPQEGCTLRGLILVVSELIGSSSSSAVLLELLHKKRHPGALILGTRDAILPVGVLVSVQMGWGSIPVLQLPEPPFQTGQRLQIRRGGLIDVHPR